MIAIHKRRHVGLNVNTKQIYLSIDGVKESNSKIRSLHCYSVKFKGCKTWYLFAVVRGKDRIKPDHAIMLKRVICDIL